jgi:arabinoxylan arabinofuranohydrolase
MLCIKRSASLLFFYITLAIFVQPLFAATDDFSSYLFTYFTGNDKDSGDEAIRFALSDDAHTFKQLNNGNPVLSSAKISLTGGVRDPHILRGENNDYYMVATDMIAENGWDSNHGIVMLRSTNLIDWKSSTVDIHTAFTVYNNADRVWAPQTIYDPVEKKYMVYFAMRLTSADKDKIYYAYADSTFTKLETVPKVLYAYGNNPVIDADIIYKDSTYHLFFKTEANGNGIKSALSKKLTEGYELYDKYLQVTTSAVEGSCVFKIINSDTYVLMYDVYTSGRYEFAISTDLKTFTKDPNPISFDFTPRHGTIIPITNDEKNALLAKWNPTAVVKERAKTAEFISHSYSGNSLNLKFGKYMSNTTVAFVDLSGNTVLQQVVSGTSAKVDLSRIHAGVYHVLCKTNTGVSGCIRITVK